MGTYRNVGKQVLHVEEGMKPIETHIADAGDNEKAHFLVTAANAYDDFDYMAEADRTNSPMFKPEQVEITDIRHVLMGFAGFASDMNLIKKLLFRGKTRDDLAFPPIPAAEATMATLRIKDDEIDIIHGLVGIITEAGECAEILLSMTAGETVDRVNVAEEAGDLRWYIARALRGIGMTDRECEKMNINKLYGRHGDKFDPFKDANRNLVVERKGLEAATPAPLLSAMADPTPEPAPAPEYGPCESDQPAIPGEPGLVWHDGCWRREIVRDVPGLAV